MSKETFARETRMNMTEAEEFVANFYQTFPEMTAYLNDIKRRVAESGFVQSIFGRPLYFDINRSKLNRARVHKRTRFYLIRFEFFLHVNRSNDKQSISSFKLRHAI